MESIVKRIVNRLAWEFKGKKIEKRYTSYLQKNIINKSASIISNNCWGGTMYTDMGVEYLTPTAGLFINAPCYIKFLQHLPQNLNAEIKEVQHSKYDNVNADRAKSGLLYPIGLINGDIEINFLHYPTFKEAVDKWQRRAQRVNFENLFVSMSDVDNCTVKEIEAFDKLPFKNKVFFSAKPYPQYKTVVHIKDYNGQPAIPSADKAKVNINKNFDIPTWLNNGK